MEAEVTYDGDVPTSANDVYLWSTSEGDPFTDYTADEEEGDFFPWSPGEEISMQVYFAEPSDDIEVSAEVTLSYINPQLGSPDIEFTVYANVEAVAPNLGINVVMGYGDLLYATQQPQNWPPVGVSLSNPTRLGLWHAVRNSVPWGVWFVGTVDTPNDFDDGGSGTWNWTQLVTSTDRWYRNSSSEYYDRNSNFSTGDPRLDKAFPYEATYSADGSSGVASDCPSEPIESGHEEIEIEDHFHMYMFYLPPGYDSNFVPLRRVTWWWQAHALKGTPNWSITQRDEDATVDSVESGLPQHPEWTDNIANYPGYTLRSSLIFR
ncbi:MAG: hypothetical protein WD716_00495 [Fimbriimonadaceae bacterium]